MRIHYRDGWRTIGNVHRQRNTIYNLIAVAIHFGLNGVALNTDRKSYSDAI